MPTLKLTRRTVAQIETPISGPVYHWDSDLPGFGLVARPSGARSWLCQYRTEGGRRGATKRIGLGDFGTLTVEEARAQAKRVLAKAAMGGDPAGERAETRKAETVAEISERWLAEHVAPKRSTRTERFYADLLKLHVLPEIGTMRAKDVLRRDILKLHTKIAAKATRPDKSGKSQPALRPASGGRTTANRVLATVSALFGWAAKAGIVPEGHNPARGVERFKEEGKERFLDADEIGRLGEALRFAEGDGIPWAAKDETAAGAKHLAKAANRREVFGPHAAGAIRLLLLTGMRLREVLNLRWDSYDRARGMLHLATSKTGRKTIVLGAPAIAVLESIPRLPGGIYVIAGSSAGTADEKPRADINRAWNAIRRHARIEDARIHDLRHSFAAIGADGGAGLPQIGKLLGHRVAATTARYAHVSASAERRVANGIGATIVEALGPPGGGEVVSLDERRRA